MREYKFRAWDEKEKCWIGGFAIHQSGMFSDWAGCKKINGQCVAEADWKYQHEIPHIKIMQYTGLKDKNGKEIYVGDILLFHNNHPNAKITDWKCVVEYREGSFVCEYPRDGVYNHFDSWNVPKVTWEVIGNIFEHSHLLKGDENE